MAEVPVNAEFSVRDLSKSDADPAQSSFPEITLSLDDGAFFADGRLTLPVSHDDAVIVLPTEDGLLVSTPVAVYVLPNFWSWLETDTLKIIALSDGPEYDPIDFLETFAGQDVLEQLIYSIDTSSDTSVGEPDLNMDADGILDMRDLTAADLDILVGGESRALDLAEAPARGFSDITVHWDASLNRLFTENEADFGG